MNRVSALDRARAEIMLVERASQGPVDIAALEAQARGLMKGAVGGSVPLDIKAKDQPYWDTEYLQAGLAGRPQRVTFFRSRQFAVGPQAGQTKTKTEMNMPTPGSFPEPNEVTIFGLKLTVMGSVADGSRPQLPDLETFRAYTIVSYFEGQQRRKYIFRADDFSAPGFVGGANANAAGLVLNYGPPALTDWKPLSSAFGLKAGLSFYFELETAPELQLANDLRLQMELVTQQVTTTG